MFNIETNLNTAFHPIHLNDWARREYFYYFTKMLPTGYSISVEVDITNTYNAIKRQNKKFFPTYLYLASKLIEEQQEFRVAEDKEQLGYYEVLHPSYPCFHTDNQTMSSMWTVYNQDFESFYNNYIEDQKLYAKKHGILAKPDPPPKNSYIIGMVPWIQFTGYSPVPYGNTSNNYFPVLQAGKFFDRADRKIMPFSITIHHAVADGYHVGLFLERFQNGMNNPEKWM